MAGLFSLAAQRAMEMSERKPDPVRIQAGPFNIAIPMAGGGGISSVQKNISIKGQPHELSYITPGEGDILQRLGGLGKPVEGTGGIPAYIGVGDADGLGEDYGTGADASMGGGIDMGEYGETASYTDPSIDPTGPGSAWGIETGSPLGTSYLNTFLSMLVNKVAAVSPFGMVPNLVAHLTTGRSIGELAFDEKDPSQVGTETIAGWLGGKSRSEYDHMDPDEMSTDVHGVDQPSFDEDTMSEEDFPPVEQEEEDDDTKYKALITKLFDDEEEVDEENWFQDLKPEYRRILKDMYGDEVEQTGLPDILEQAYGRRGSV